MIQEFLTRIRFLFFRKKRNELEDEIRFHLEQSTAAKVAAGMNASEARRQALVEFGDVESTREQCEQQRPGFSLGTVAQDVRYALRGILARRWFSAAIVVTLALGIGLNTMVFTLVYAVLYRPVPVSGGDRLVTLNSRALSRKENGVSIGVPMSYPDFEDYRSQTTGLFESLEAASDESGILSESGKPPQLYHLERATAGIFSMVHANALLGRAFMPGDDRSGTEPFVVIGYNVWKERYAGSEAVLGRQVRVDGLPATIVGVMPKGFRFPNDIDLWVPLAPTPSLATRDNRTLRGYAILKRGVTLREADAELNGIAERLSSQYPADKDMGISVLTFQQHFNGAAIRTIFLLMLGAAAFVLLIACADVANMMLSRSLGRQQEMSIRTALGATRWRIVRQSLIESVLLSTAGGVLGLGLAAGGAHWFDLSTSAIRPYWIHFTMDFSVLGYLAAISILSGLLFGVAPALRSSNPDLVGVLKEGAHSVGYRGGGWLSSGLVVFQFALTLVLLTGAGIFTSSLFRSLSINPFIPAAELTTARIQLPDSRYKDNDARLRFYDELVTRLRAIPGVSHAAVTSAAPGLGTRRRQIELEHAPIANPAQRPWISLVAVSPGYLDAIDMPLLRGRKFNETDGSDRYKVAILTRDAAARLWPGQDPIGKRFRLFDERNKPSAWITVAGLSADMVQDIQENDPRPLLFVPYRQEGWSGGTLLVRSAADPLQSIRKAVQSLDPELPLIEPSRLSEALEQRVWLLRVFGHAFLGFALIALLMASVGVYAVIAQATSSRTQEIGVRIAVGATLRGILMLVMKRGLWQIACGLLLGLGAALPVGRLMTSLPIGGVWSEPAILFLVAATLASVGVFACWLPARRAASLDPVKAIRYE